MTEESLNMTLSLEMSLFNSLNLSEKETKKNKRRGLCNTS